MLHRLAIIALLSAGAAVHADTLYVSNNLGHEVHRYDPTTGALIDVLVAAGTGGLNQPHGIIERENDLIVASFGTNQILRFDKDTGAFLGELAGPASGLSDPVYMLEIADGDLLVSSQASEEILWFTADGTLVGDLVAAGAGGLDGPSGFAFGPDGRLYVAGRYSANVIAYDGLTGAFDEVLLDATDGLGAGTTFGLQFAADGSLYVASNGAVHRYDIATDTVTNTVGFGFPIGLEVDPAGDIVVANANNLFTIDHDNSDAVAGPFLSGGVINILNFFHRAPTPAPGCAGDVDGDGDTDVFDFGDLASNFGAGPGATREQGDLTGDGFVDVFDFGDLASDFGCGED